ncbi:MAG: ankyrin repeat domain-containing protein [Elusimicrobia bacterium]|nr:ankyrin repeat domain-containing protein [Elusimicrobiota bacterium]
MLKTLFQKHLIVTSAVLMAVLLCGLVAYTLLINNASSGSTAPVTTIPAAKTPDAVVDECIGLLKQKDYDTFALKVKDLKDVNVFNQQGETLMNAAVRYNNMDAAQLLYSMSADVNLANPNTGETPLMTAMRGNNDSMLEFLIAAGANLNAVSNYGATVLLLAVENKNSVWIDRLISRGATAGASSANLLTYTARANMPGVAAMLKSGISPNIKDSSGFTPLYMAASMGELDMVKWLVGYKADLDAPVGNGSTPLIGAARYRKPDVAAFLMDKGANVNARNKAGETALYWASVNNMVDTATQLLLLKADATVKTNSGYTPYRAADERKFVDMLALFKKNNITQ